jgi:transglutaminase-like putative cysteine protease
LPRNLLYENRAELFRKQDIMLRSVQLMTVCFLIFATGCTDKHLINSKEYRFKVDTAFAEREKLVSNRKAEIFSIFNRNLSLEQTQAVRFLIAYSPLNDLAVLNGEFFLANANVSLNVRNDTKWGKTIPDDIFLHYVLPFRVNNENPDSFRIAYYDEIKNRTRGLDAVATALEINHWCHEKVSYQPADIRTSAPMSTILSARGRCGEESTFTVAALRTAGIPARQVYTPRWAHSDDNHAWVEVWINGEWYYMGSCEPEPVLDRGWFTEPARRAMLIHTKSFGAYSGNENAIIKEKYFSEINNLSKYAVTKTIYIKVLDSENALVPDAMVEYQLYNYAEFYPLAIVPTDKNGISRFETGLGDLIIWARKGDAFNFKKVTVNEVDTLTINLNRKASGSDNMVLDLGVPVIRTPFKGPETSLIAENNKRVNTENVIRQKYIDSWMKPADTESLALKLEADPKVLKDLIGRSMGNYQSIIRFLESTAQPQRTLAITLLCQVAEKDLRDTPASIFSDHLNNVKLFDGENNKIEKELFDQYILNPRIANEILSGWRGFFQKNLSEELKRAFEKDPIEIVKYLDSDITITDNQNYYNTPITPEGVFQLKVSDSFSRDICFVAICRSLGIPARLEQGSNIPQYFFGKKWNDVHFAGFKNPTNSKGFIRFLSSEKNPVPEYYIHFTLARFENGRYNTLEYDYNKKVTDFKDELELASGHYMLVTGNRINDSRILSTISFFDLKTGEHKTVNIELRKDVSKPEISGNIDLKRKIVTSEKIMIPLDSLSSKGMVIAWIEPDKEPTKHIFNDLPLLKNELDSWGGNFIFLTNQSEHENYFDFKALKGLPQKSLFGTDEGSVLLKETTKLGSVSDIRFPYIILVNKSGNIIFRSEGYMIGIGEQILKKIFIFAK